MTKDIKSKLGGIDLSEQFSELVRYRIPTGIIAIDRVIHGGVPSGKITEVYGGWSAGKSRLVLHIIAQTLKLAGHAILIDTERALEAGLCDLVNLDINHPKFIYADPQEIEAVEDVFGFIEKAIDIIRVEDPNGFLLIGWDSLAATPTRDDLKKLSAEKGIADGVNISAARRAKLVGRGIRRLSAKLFRTHSCLILVNQLTDRFDVMFGDKTTTPGGKAAKFHASLRMKLALVKKLKNDQTQEQVGNEVKLVIEKSRIGLPFGMVQFEMKIDEPISEYAGLLDYMLRHGEIDQRGSKYIFLDEATGDVGDLFTKAEFSEAYKKWRKDNAKNKND